MLNSENNGSFQQPVLATGRVPYVAELALLIDAIPPEYREDVMLAALRTGKDKVLESSYFVSRYRKQLHDCLAEITGSTCQLNTLCGCDHRTIQRQISSFATAADPAQITLLLCGLLDSLGKILMPADFERQEHEDICGLENT